MKTPIEVDISGKDDERPCPLLYWAPHGKATGCAAKTQRMTKFACRCGNDEPAPAWCPLRKLGSVTIHAMSKYNTKV